MYTFENTERNNYKASNYETKSLLYLIGGRKDRKEISVITIDCFNDVTGINTGGNKLWDVQSKGEKKLTPRKIGKYLYTLYDNFDSSLVFYKYIFFMPPLNKDYLDSGIRHTYKTKNFLKKQQKKIKEGLVAEVGRVKKTHNTTNIDKFLSKVIFVEDRKKESTYIKDVLNFEGKNDKENTFYDAIFNEIRDQQSAKKNSYIEGKKVTCSLDVLKLERHINSKDIHALIVNRFVGVDLFKSNMMFPMSFSSEVKSLDEEDLKDLIQECKSNICRAFFDKNSKTEFWKVFNRIIILLNTKKSFTIRDIYSNVDKKLLTRLIFLNERSILFLAALIKDGLNSDN